MPAEQVHNAERQRIVGSDDSEVGLVLPGEGLQGGQVLAVATGLASGKTEPTGWQWALVLGSLVIYILAIIEVGIGGVMVLRDLFKRPQLST